MRTKSRAPEEKPATDIDEVKRRSIRQNRELAKYSSAQFLKIQSLHLEISKLLSNNLQLRERVLGLENQLQDTRRQASNATIGRVKAHDQESETNNLELQERVPGLENELQGARRHASNAAIKADLRSKLAELSGMVEELEDDGTADIDFEREVVDINPPHHRERYLELPARRLQPCPRSILHGATE
ncbi:unnamed protein product [Zymoseptoria tritici ST99CH_3D7]|uniref:Shugoshin N-terminal coiled-coil domain-containing protein n=1 Tax=Zymoseptoria tritici (strain ST99CH_3D7) TaxID=1276538 RepID=A0A1X7SAE0_ZYMT9|nr:unnamed protein product [Zymoseptoria tritici ST99CH_3D7]